jgi:hypothetical protein
MARILSSRQSGQPGFGTPKESWPRLRHPLHPIRAVRTLIKNDPADGITQPEARNLIGGDGVSTPGRGGYKGARRIFQNPLTPPAPNSGLRRIRTPRSGRLTRR